MILDFPDLRQSKDYTCGVSALQSILYYYGIDYCESTLERMLHTTYTNGTNPNNIIKFCNHLGFKTQQIANLTLSKIKHFIKNKIPILTMIQSCDDPKQNKYSWECGHYCVIIGFDENTLIIEDPSSIGKCYISYDELIQRWHDQDQNGLKYYQYGIMIYGKSIKYDSHLLTKLF